MTTETKSMTHIFLKPCGCLSCAIVNSPNTIRELAQAHRYAKKHGETYQLIETEQVRTMSWKCPIHGKEQANDQER